jgi:hypothetical protein
MPRKLHAVPVSEECEVDTPPTSLVEAANRSRRDLLVGLRNTVAETIEGGVPAHALARLADEVEKLDSAIRKIDQDRETVRDELAVVEDVPFDATAI